MAYTVPDNALTDLVARMKNGRAAAQSSAEFQRLKLPIPAANYSGPVGFWSSGSTPITAWEIARMRYFQACAVAENMRRLGTNYDVAISTYEPNKHPETNFSQAEFDRAWRAVYDALQVGM